MQWIDDELAHLAATHLLRHPSTLAPTGATGVVLDGAPLVNFCGNDYLGLRVDPSLIRASCDAAERYGTGSGASRLVTGNTPVHERAERALAALTRTESALLVSSGYAANVGALSALAGDGDVIFSDALNHASLIDGARLSRARTVVFPHRDVDSLRARIAQSRPFRRGFVVTESLFSMDATVAPLADLRALCDREGLFLYVDEAHALGLYGDGAGLCHAHSVRPDLLVGTLGKALGAHGAFLAGSASVRAWLWNRARSFVFSTAVTPSCAGVALAACGRVRDDSLRARLFANIAIVRDALGSRALGALDAPIVPLVMGDESRAVRASEALCTRGYYVRAIRPPTVPTGTSRLRVTLSAAHTPDEIQGLLHALRDLL